MALPPIAKWEKWSFQRCIIAQADPPIAYARPSILGVAGVSVGAVLPFSALGVHEKTNACSLLIEFIGGEPGEATRDQFA
jgi:hypothetical protein